MKREIDRRRSFLGKWRFGSVQDPWQLAEAGFFYYSEPDKVQCAFCSGIIGYWEQGENPFVAHRRYFSRCPFILGLSVENVPAHQLSRADIISRSTAEEYDWAVTTTRSDDGYSPNSKPVFPSYLTISSRLKTFSDWPNQIKQKSRALAEAGFYYTGSSDEVKCFHCDISLKEWKDEDDEWERHAKRNPNCHHVNLVKGRDYVKKIV